MYTDVTNDPDVFRKNYIYLIFCIAYSLWVSIYIHRVIERLKRLCNLSWMKLIMSYHRFNNLIKMIIGDLTENLESNNLPQLNG